MLLPEIDRQLASKPLVGNTITNLEPNRLYFFIPISADNDRRFNGCVE